MRYIKAVACPVCGKMNNVPENIELLLTTEVFRKDDNVNQEKLKVITQLLEELDQILREHVLTLLKRREKDDPNDWIDVECINAKTSYGRHSFRYHTGTGEVLR